MTTGRLLPFVVTVWIIDRDEKERLRLRRLLEVRPQYRVLAEVRSWLKLHQ